MAFTKAEADLRAPTANRKVSEAAPMQNVEDEKIPGLPNGMLAEMSDPKKPIVWRPGFNGKGSLHFERQEMRSGIPPVGA